MTLLCVAACTPQQQTRAPETAKAAIQGERFVTATGEALPLRHWQPKTKPRAVLVALHGFNDYSRAFEMPAWYLSGKGMAVYAYDQRGFGASAQPGIWPGDENLIADLKDFVRAVHEKHPKTPVFLLGESMGGAVILSALSEPDMPPVSGAILSAPAVWGEGALNPFFRAALWLMAHGMPEMKMTGEDLRIMASSNIDMLRQMGMDPMVIKATRVDAVYGLVELMDRASEPALSGQTPVVVLYGANDQVIPADAVAALQTPLSGKAQFSCYPKGYHLLLRDRDAKIPLSDIVAWVRKPGTPMPSGGEQHLTLCKLHSPKENGHDATRRD